MPSLPAKRPLGLTSSDKAAALLEAHGHTLKSMSRALGVSVSTLMRLRANEEYRAEVAKFRELGVDSIRPLVNRVNTEIMEGVSVAVKTLIEMCAAEDADGNPLYGVRADAAKNLGDLGIKIVGPTVAAQERSIGASEGPRTPTAAISFSINTETGRVKVDAEGEAEDA